VFNRQCLRPNRTASNYTTGLLIAPYYITKLYYFVAILSLTYFANVILKIKNVDKIKNVKIRKKTLKYVKNVTKIKK